MTHKERRILIKNIAKERLKTNNTNPYLATLIVGGCFVGIVLCAFMIMFAVIFTATIISGISLEVHDVRYVSGNIGNNMLSLILNGLFLFLSIGFSWYTMKAYRGEKNRYIDVFSAFSKKGLMTWASNIIVYLIYGLVVTVITVVIMMILLVFVFINLRNGGSSENLILPAVISVFAIVVLCIPAYILLYSFRLINYIMYDDSKTGVIDAISISFKMMKGHKWELFKLDLTFMGWYFINAITLGFASIFTMPYIYISYAGFYDEIKKEYFV